MAFPVRAASLERDAFVVPVSCPLRRRRVKQRASSRTWARAPGMWKHLRKEPERAGKRGTCSREPIGSAAAEHALALLVDDLLALGDGEGRGLVAARMGLGAHEAVLLCGPVGRLLLDDAAGLVAAGRGIGGGADAVALVLDGIEARLLGRRAAAAAREAGPQGLQDRDHRGAPLQGIERSIAQLRARRRRRQTATGARIAGCGS